MELMDNKGFFDFFFYIIIWLSVAEFAIQMAISDLSQKVKDLLSLSQPYRLNALCRFNFWRKLFGKMWIVAAPLLVPITILFKIHRFFSEMLACPYCTAYHLAWITNFFVLKQDIITALILAPMALVFVAILDRLHSNG